MVLSAGTRLGTYETLAALWGGRHGEVYHQSAIKSMAIIEGGLCLLRKGHGKQRHES